MREMKIHLPTRDNDGNPLDDIHLQLRKRLCAEFGGFTAIQAFGGWANHATGELFEESGICYLVSADCAGAKGKLHRLARWIGAAARQQAMYACHVDGTVEILTISKVRRAVDLSACSERKRLPRRVSPSIAA